MILIISNKEDLTKDFVVLALQKQGADYYRLNTEDLFSKIKINLDFENKKYILKDLILNKIIDLQYDITSVYYRRPLLPNFSLFSTDKAECDFLQKEFFYILNGLYTILKNKFWINYPTSVMIAENKILQLQIAQEIGFKIPKTLLSNINANKETFAKSTSCILKPVKTGKIIQNEHYIKQIYTNEITPEEIKNNTSSFPIYIQEKIHKQYDIRITVVDDAVFAVSIANDNTCVVDWRQSNKKDLTQKVIKLPQYIENLCINLLKKLNLKFGAIDMALDNNGEYIFFEINPNGQWAWLDNELDLHIKDKIANLLIQGDNNV